MTRSAEVTLPADAPEFILTRIFKASRALVYKCWMEPSHLARWWGPKPFTCPVCEVEPRVGGEFKLVMRSPQGNDYPMRGIFREIVPNIRIVKEDDMSEHSEEWHDMVDPTRRGQGKRKIEMLTTVTFEDHGKGTRVTITTRFPSLTIRDSFAKVGMKEGWSSSLEKLEDLLDAIKVSPNEFHFTRLINEAREKTFKAFSDPVGLAVWWGPNGFTTTTHAMDFGVGGAWTFTMHGPDGVNYPNHVVYTKIDPPRVITWDHHGEADKPALFKAVISFDEDGRNTRVTLRLILAEAHQRDGLLAFGAVEGGWQNLARLESYLTSATV